MPGLQRARRWLAIAAPALLLLTAGSACDKPSAAHTTSPSAIALAGTANGDVTYGPGGPLPSPAAPEGWRFDVGNARFAELEDGAASIQVVTDMRARGGATFGVWLAGETGALASWSGGSTSGYAGTLCFQLRLESGGEALPLDEGPWHVILGFVDPATGQTVAASSIPVAGTPPDLSGGPPSPGSEVFRDLLGCPRSVI